MATQLTSQQLIDSDIEAYLRKHEEKELLRFVTVGSVDDGKSTLIGRLLYESHGVYEDQLASVKKASEHKGSAGGEIDFALITDGLRSEREQGITIDVAYRYFNTEKRKFIIADTPGHVQYTRNMATGASTADVGIILIDARQGILQQSRRHAYIASLLGIPNLLVAINKMDLVDYSPERYEEIAGEFQSFAASLIFTDVTFIPVSALMGDNVVHRSERTAWYQGKTILEHLETVPIQENIKAQEFYFPVQYVIRPNLDFRGFSGTIASGEIGVGEEIIVLPSGKSSRVKSIVTYDGTLTSASQDQAVTITLEDEIDISRGDVLVKPENPFHLSHRFTGHLVWMNEAGLKPGKAYWVKQASSLYQGSVSKIDYRVNMDDLSEENTETLGLNDIGQVIMTVNRPMVMDRYQNNRQAGAFILIDRMSNLTVAAGMISGYAFDEQQDIRTLSQKLTSKERARHFGQKPAVLWFTGRPGSAKIILARALEKRLFETGYLPYVLDPERVPHADRHATGQQLESIMDYADVVLDSGAIVISAFTTPFEADRQRVKEKFSDVEVLEIFSDVEVQTAINRLEGLGRDTSTAELEYQTPLSPDLIIDANDLNIQKMVDVIICLLNEKGIL